MNPHCRLLSLLVVLSVSVSFGREVRLEELDLSGVSTGWGSVGKGVGASGAPMKIGGKTFEHGVGVHAPSEIVLSLDGRTTAFRASVGVDDAPNNDGSVVFQVLADGETLFESPVMSKGDEPVPVEVDLTGRKSVRLRVTDAGDGIDSDHGNWIGAVLDVEGELPASVPAWTTEYSHYEGTADVPATAKPFRTIASPDGSVSAEVISHDGRLWIRVLRNGRPAIEASPIGVTIDGVDFGKNAKPGAAKAYSANETYPWLGNQKTLTNHFNGERIAMTTDSQAWELDVRAYDDGVAWRYVVPGKGRRKVEGEATSYVMPAGSKYWTHQNTVAYEANYESFDIDGRSPAGPITMPVTVELPSGGFACYTESEIMHYSGMTLGVRGRLLNGLFQDDPSGWTMNGDIATPWRVVIAVGDLNALVNSSIAQSVCPPPDPKLFPEGIRTDWIKPGRCYWTWIVGQHETARWERIKGYVDDAAALNCQYYTIDDPWRDPRMGWHRNGGDEWDGLKEITAYAKKKGVGIMVWQHWNGIRDLEARKEFFENVAKAGAKGVKIDFMESESHERLEFYRSCLEIAARHKLIVNFHGSNKPAGEMRTWPNGLTREGIYGLEQGNGLQPQTWAALPFTRLVTGAGDFTPTGLHPDRLFGYTMVMQLASAIVFTSPIEHWADSAEVYLSQPKQVVEFIRTKPTVWDETIVLPGSKIGEVAGLARRDGNDWWIGVLNGTEEQKTFAVPMPKLKPGRYEMVQFQDGEAKDRLEIRHGEITVSKDGVPADSSIDARLMPRGGFAMILRAVD